MATHAAMAAHPATDATSITEIDQPYIAHVTVEGIAPFIFHRWSVDSIEAKSKAAKGSKTKKEDDLESYVYRNQNGTLYIPGEYFRQAIIGAAKFRQDPRSPRKSAADLFKAGCVAIEDVCSLGTKDWDYVDRRRVMVQRNGVTRARPTMAAGWRVTVPIMVNIPEYIPLAVLEETVRNAGRLIGVGDFRPTFGRFAVMRIEVR